MSARVPNALGKTGQAARLLKAARAARKRAVCPLTGYAVGAAVLGESGRIYPGANVESRTGIIHICADRAAIFNALSHGEKHIKAIATVSAGSVPCGACRQAILEFGSGDTPIYSLQLDGPLGRETVVSTRISKLLPSAHTPELVERFR